MGDIRVGTASWTDKTLVDSQRFYPEEAKSAEDRLRFYATRFATVEVDSSYYGLPSARNAELWAERTPKGFSFVVKAFRLFTLHHTAPEALPKDIRASLGPITKKNLYYADLPAEIAIELWSRFRSALAPLQRADKLAGVLFQFPPWFMRSRANHEHILRCREILGDARICVEFRNRTWFDDSHRDEVLQFEREHEVSNVVVDEPQGFASSIPWVGEVTAPSFVMVRLHGRNANTWEAKGLASSGERFNYLYSATELNELADKVRPLAARAQRTYQQLRGLRGAQRARLRPPPGQLTLAPRPAPGVCRGDLPGKAPQTRGFSGCLRLWRAPESASCAPCHAMWQQGAA